MTRKIVVFSSQSRNSLLALSHLQLTKSNHIRCSEVFVSEGVQIPLVISIQQTK